MNYINCTFKLAYTCNTFSKLINLNISPYHFKNIIKSNINSSLRINTDLIDFNIILAGTNLGENNLPINCNIRNLSISSFIGKIYNNHVAFYIKLINNNNQTNNNCSICYNRLISLQTITFGCNHTFCRNCIVEWFQLNNRICPLCRS